MMRRLILPLQCFCLMMTLVFVNTTYARDLPDFTGLVEKNQNTVVNISTTRVVKRQQNQTFNGPPEMEELLRHFFGQRLQPYGQDEPEEFSSRSLGSGFIISSDGYVLTNNHVIRDADEIIVRLNDGRELEAKVVGTDSGTDLALLKIKGSDFPVVAMGDSNALKVGEWVLAIGSPFGFEHSVTAGIVSAKGRGLRTEQYVPFIQTDVAINPGNSGGPLFNLNGEVIGINSQILSRTGGYLGLSFAIPSNIAMDVVQQLKQKGFVSRGWLGVAFQDIDRSLAASFGLKTPHGALVAQVVDDSPASKAGVKPGDIIVEFNGSTIKDAVDLAPLVGKVKPGTTVNVDILREKKSKQLKVTIEELNDDDKVAEKAPDATPAKNLLGLKLRSFTADEKTRYELSDQGLLVEDVVHNSPAFKAGIRPNDIVLSVNLEPLKSVNDFNKATKSLKKGQTVAVLVNRRGGQRYFALKLG